MATLEKQRYILGLDIGTNSIGWAILGLNGKDPESVIKTGSRIFSEAVEGDIERGQDQPKSAARRAFRQRKRLLARQTQRLIQVCRVLQEIKLLPPGDIATPNSRHEYFKSLDRQLLTQDNLKTFPHTFAYVLRAEALKRPLTPLELGRTFYHLAQRRGFLSNRKTPMKRDEKPGELAKKINTLSDQIKSSGARTLGEYFSRLDPIQERIRSHHTSRQMYHDEFNMIWDAQAPHHSHALNAENKAKLFRAIFYQRPLKLNKYLIGKCSLEPDFFRAPLSLFVAQRFRFLQKVNDLQLWNRTTGESRRLTDSERHAVGKRLEDGGDISFSKLRSLLELTKEWTFNFEKEDGEKGLPGNRTNAKLKAVFDSRWIDMSSTEKERALEDLRSFRSEQALERRGINYWKLAPEQAKNFSKINLEDGYCALSKKALGKLLPEMEKGTPYATARKALYGEDAALPSFNFLPNLYHCHEKGLLPALRNPTVSRSLSELRKVVNAIITSYGKPELIRVELARELKKSRKDRLDIWKRNQKNRKSREEAAQTILNELGIKNPSRADIEKYLLWEESNKQCPYTGNNIALTDLFHASSPVDVEHIIPFTRCLDDSFINKTLCYADENRKHKRNKTPYEAYGKDLRSERQWKDILERVKKFKGPAAETKLRRFMMKDLRSFDDFCARQLNDTRYASRLAVQYLGLLYGPPGAADENKRKVKVTTGQVTHYIRDIYGLNGILGDGGQKTREDHRHHAVDAIAIGLTDGTTIRRLSEAASKAVQEGRKRFASVQLPWNGFLDEVRNAVASTIPSHQPRRKVNGQLHDQTYYSHPKVDSNGNSFVHVRKAVDQLNQKEVEEIVDPAVKAAVKSGLNGLSPDKAFMDRSRHPFMTTKDGRKIPIHSVRIKITKTTTPIGQGLNARHVITGSNHHVEILETKDKKGKLKWDGSIVSRLEALRRLQTNAPIIKRDHGPNKKFMFSLSGGDIFQLTKDGIKELCVVRCIGVKKKKYANIEYVNIRDARKKDEITKSKLWGANLLEPLRKSGCKKVIITPLGEIRDCND